jgi:integrase
METAQTTFREQAEKFLSDAASDARPNTLASYRSILNARVIPFLGEEDLANIDSATAKSLKDRLIEGGLSPATVNLAVGLMKKVVGSATDSRGNRLYTPKWNNDFIRLPKVNPRLQKAPIAASQTLTEAISALKEADTAPNSPHKGTAALIALLAGTGLRVGEALAIGAPDGNVWDSEAGTITVRATMVRGQVQPNPKTEAGNRVVDLHPDLNAFLRSQFANPESQLFPDHVSTYERKLSKLGIHGFHSLRRFRITYQKMQNVPDIVVKYAVGHAAGDITERYTKVGSEIEARRRWVNEAGLGFQL